jgi:hypothetical protein
MHLALLIAALVCFILAAINATIPKVNPLALGLAFWVAATFIV